MFKYMLMIIKSIPLGIKRGDITIIVTVAILVTAILAPSVFNQGLRAAMSPLLEMKQQKLQQEEQKIAAQEKALLQSLKKIPAREYKKNLRGYKELLQLRPNNKKYKAKVEAYKALVNKQDAAMIKAAKAKKAKKAKEKARAIAKAKAAAKAKAVAKAKAAAKAREAKIKEFKEGLIRTKWAGDIDQYRKKGRYFTAANIILKFRKDGKVDFNIYKDKMIETSQGKFTPVASALFYSNTGTFNYTVDSNLTVRIKVSGLEEVKTGYAKWNPNKTWTVKSKGKKRMLLETRGLSAALEKKTY